MIFVTLGTTTFHFHSIVGLVNDVVRQNPRERIVIQSGNSTGFLQGSNVSVLSYLSEKTFASYVKKARIVITHAGEGTVLQCLVKRSLPTIILPRKELFFEHIDDQQVLTTLRLKKFRQKNIFFADDEKEFWLSWKKANHLGKNLRKTPLLLQQSLRSHFLDVVKMLERYTKT